LKKHLEAKEGPLSPKEAMTRTMRTLELWAQNAGLAWTADDLSLTFAGLSRKELERRLTCLADEEPNAIELAALMEDKRWERFDEYVDVTLLDKANSTYRLDVASACEAARRATHGPRHGPPRWLSRR
jgi:hypothetical protein